MNTQKGSFWLRPGTSISPILIADLAVCTSPHERLPVMEGIYFNNRHVIASDSHNLRLLDMVEPQGEIDAVIIPTTELLQKLREYAFDEVEVQVFSWTMDFLFEGSPVKVELSKWIYPPYMPVIDELKKCKTFLSFDKASLKNMIALDKSKILHFVRTKKGYKGFIGKDLMDCFTEVDRPGWDANGVIAHVESEFIIDITAINPFCYTLKSLDKVSNGFEEEIIIGFYNKNKPAGIWLRSSGMDVKDELF